MDAYFARVLPPDEPGGAVLVMKNDRVVFARGYGLADTITREKVTTRTLFNIGSISKTFVAYAILILRSQGRLSVDDNLAKYFPSFKHPEIAKRVTIAHLLTHTSGLPDNREVDKNPTFFLTAKDAENWYPITQADALAFEPGSRFAYSNPAYDGLALIVEQVAGIKWQQFVHDKIFVPSGMTTSTITDGPHPDHGVAHGYDKAQNGWVENDYGEYPTFAAAGNGGVWSSVEELAAYERAIESSSFLDAATIADSRTVKRFANWSSSEPPYIGWSWFVGFSKYTRDDPDAPRIIGHTGSQGGFHSNYVTIPDKKLFFVILTGSERDRDAYEKAIVRILKEASWLDD